MALWNGNRGALSLTFDDALAVQRDYALPAMEKYDIQGTFFAITNCPDYPLDVHAFRKAVAVGNEVGSHSVRHLKAATLDANAAAYEARESKRVLENHFGQPVTSFCYPYTDAPQILQDAVIAAGYKQARGGRVARKDKYILPSDGVNLYNLPCYHVNEGCFSHNETFAWVDAALERGAWLNLMFHGVGPDGAQWDNVEMHTFNNLLIFLQDRKKKGLWVAPFGTVAENLRQHRK